MKRTPLYAEHKRLGARMVPFGGWEMPVQYTGIKAEHKAVREKAGIFDVSHMGEVRLRGPDALRAVARLFTNKTGKLAPGKAQYTAMLNEDGGILDDLIVYMRGEEDMFLCINAGNTEADYQWMCDHVRDLDVTCANESAEWGLVAVQGPASRRILPALTAAAPNAASVAQLKPFTFCDTTIAGVDVVVARTGYTGEHGYEIFIPAEETETIWRRALDEGRSFGLSPAGLGARDTLRLEMGYALHGHDITPATTPLEAGLHWICDVRDGDFIGADALRRQKKAGVPRRLVGVIMDERGIAREGYAIHAPEGDRVGAVTSGTMSPTLNTPVALGYVPSDYAAPDTRVAIDIRGSRRAAHVVRPPFYTPTR